MRSKKKYMNGQGRGGIPGMAVDTDNAARGKTPKSYHKMAIAFHGSESNLEKYVKAGRRGYGYQA